MKTADIPFGKIVIGFAALCLAWIISSPPTKAAPGIPQDFDAKGVKIYDRYEKTPLAAMTGTDGKRTLNTYYKLRQYPGSPPRIPHSVKPSFSADPTDCLSCHGRGGYVSELKAYAPVTPHPENELCYQCHLPVLTNKLFVETNWQSINPPLLGRSQLGGSPPAIPHSLQLREDCIACHSGPAAVAEIRVEHASRGNCRQCHLPMVVTTPMKEFTRDK